ncbi:MAG TPA: hypothetical protein VNF06_02820 [Candidatus Aquilonibacter sp.]|nr:hypothetical protein [Candidatus Aquilonibacter sp.]
MEQSPDELIEKLLSEEKRFFSAISSLTITSSIGAVVVSEKKIDSEETEFDEVTEQIIKGIKNYAAEKRRLTDEYLLLLDRTAEEIKRMSA